MSNDIAGNTTDILISGNIKYKDTLFRFIFGAHENRHYLLSLYNAINKSEHTNPDDLEITTLQNVIYISIKNDLSFLLDSELNLYEHQSTFNPNMPFRGLLYMAQLYHRQLYEKNLYGSTLIKIPAPQYIVFYNGTEEHPDKQYLKLSDAFEKPVKDGWYEWTTIMYNINEGHNEGLMQACKALKDYATYVAMVRKYYEKLHNLREAIDCALSEAIDKNLLDGFFGRHKQEVFMTNLFEFNKELYEKDIENKGEIIGEKKTIKLIGILIKDKKYDEINLAVENEEYLHQLYKKYQIES